MQTLAAAWKDTHNLRIESSGKYGVQGRAFALQATDPCEDCNAVRGKAPESVSSPASEHFTF